MTHLRNRHLFVLDALLLSISPFLVYGLRFEGFSWGPENVQAAMMWVAVMLPLRLGIYWVFGLYSRLWRYASIQELELIFIAGAVAALVSAVVGTVLLPGLGVTAVRVPYSVVFTNGLLSVGIIATPRLMMRMRQATRARRGKSASSETHRLLIAGAGAAGHMLVRELRDNPQIGLEPVGFLDDDVSKQGLRLSGLPVFGPLSAAREIIKDHAIDEVAIAMPRAAGAVVRPLVRVALDMGVRTRTIPAFFEIVSGAVNVGTLRDIKIEDLLRREPVQTDLSQLSDLLTERVVLVTGAGGSIGSELARQIAQMSPVKLLIMGHGENPIFYINNELVSKHPELDIVPIIADVRDRRRMFGIMAEHKPFAIFHAAAHKHVPLMEGNVIESVTNNVKGTQNLVEAALAAKVEHLVLISTDKAVRPTNVMGATKRCAEHIVRHAALTHGVNYVAVRFGNVLGSQGSVVPTFLEQIRRGGPVTVTHPEMRRYFMTIPEAVQLVLQAGAMGQGGELFVLDMGEPVKIVDLATDLIRLSGLEPGSDIQIRFSGTRPGEKLYEELFFSYEQATPTAHPKILCGRDPVKPSSIDKIDELIALTLGEGASAEELRRRLVEIVPDFVQQPHMSTPPGGTPSFPMPVVPVEETAPVYRSSSGKTRRISKEKALEAVMPRSPKIES